MKRKTQLQMFRQAETYSAGVNNTFLEIVKDGLTKAELQANINRRPELWGRFENWLDKLA